MVNKTKIKEDIANLDEQEAMKTAQKTKLDSDTKIIQLKRKRLQVKLEGAK